MIFFLEFYFLFFFIFYISSFKIFLKWSNNKCHNPIIIKGQSLVTNFIVANDYNSTQYCFIGCEFWQIYHWITFIFYIFRACKISLQQRWAMVMKSSENKQFHYQMITFSEEKKNSSPNIIKILKFVTKYLFRHYRSLKKKANLGWRNIRVTKDLPKVRKF